MRVLDKKILGAMFILSLFLVTITFVPEVGSFGAPTNTERNETSPVTPNTEIEDPLQNEQLKNDNSILSSNGDPYDGVLNPVAVEQSGYVTSGNISARTDTYENLVYDLPLDTTHSWVADQAEVSVWNLQRQYALNGSFSHGIAGININPNGTIDAYPLGWSANSTDGGDFPDDLQIASYDDTGRKFVVVESIGGKTGQQGYTHDGGTRIVWTQHVDNTPYSEDFLLSFDYFYVRGPLDYDPAHPITGDINISVFVDGSTIWSFNLKDLAERGVWTSTGSIHVSIPGAPSSFDFAIGLDIPIDQYLDIRWDYDNNGVADGVANAAYITVYLDDVAFVKETPPTPDQVDLQFSTGGVSELLSGSLGVYAASILNSSYWSAAIVPVSLSANASISFDYKTRLFSHRFTNSNWRTDIASTGVRYSIERGKSANLLLYTYVGYLGDYEDPMMTVNFPSDWENVTVSDPFLTDQTSFCTVYSDFFTIPTEIITYLGWWEIKFESPNYAKSIVVEKYDSDMTDWTVESIYRIGNSTRTKVTIGTAFETPITINSVNVSWLYPNGGEWVNESLNGGVAGVVTGSSHTFSSGTSPAGEWNVEILWVNGTEVAYDIALFEVHHSSVLIGNPEIIPVDAGELITAIVRFSDGDTGAYITDELTTVSGNWSLSTIFFDPNPVKNWWEVGLNTGDIGAGSFIVHVDALRPYFDPASCEILIVSTNVTRLNSPNAPWTSAKWGSKVTLTFNFEVYDYGSSSWGPVVNNSDVSAIVNWTVGYWNVSEDSTPGIYLFDIDTSALPSGTYLLGFNFTKPNHESQELFLTLIVSPMASSLVIFGGSSDRVDIEEPRVIKMRYSDEGGNPVQTANIVIDSITPSSGLSHTSIQAVSGEEGNYSLTVTPFSPTVFTIRFVSTGDDVEPASTVFVLLVNDVVTNLEIYSVPTIEIDLSDTYNTTLRYDMFNGTGIENADISVIYSGPASYLSWNISETLSGNYTIQFAAGLPATYVITIIASKQYYQQAAHSFSLIVKNIPTNLQLSVGSSVDMGLTDTYEMTILYEMDNGTGIEDATIQVVHSGSLPAISSLVSSNGLGNYSIHFTATLAGSYLVTISATKQFHQGTAGSFLLVVRDISTTFASLNGTGALVGFGHDYRFFVSYQNGSGYGLSGANVSVVDADPGISWDDAEMVTPGIYSILLTPLVSDSFSLVVQASLLNHQTKIVFFTLTVTAIPTTLVTLNLSTSIAVDQYCTVYLEFQDEDSTALENAILGILNPPSGIDYSLFEELGNGVYRVTLTPLIIGTFDIVFRAQKDGYQLDYAGFTLTATIIQTELRTDGGVSRDSVMYSNQYELPIFYERTDLNQNVSLASIDLKSSPTIGLSWSVEDLSTGYLLTINSNRTGRWTLTITANRTNYAISSIQFILDITPIPISVEYLSERSVMEGTPFEVSLRLTIQGTQTPIRNASVSYRISSTGTGQFIGLEESQTPGIYSGTFTIPLYLDTTEYTVEVRVDKENYELLGASITFTILKGNNDILRWTPVISVSGISISLIIGMAVGLRVYNTRKRRRNLEALQVKKRFDDVSNILGIIVLHKNTGLPVYSKMIKGGFEEAMVSAFITAITHFRSEFQMDEKHWEFNIIPISDIISAVPTKSLIVAFITVRPPSKFQETSMAAFGRATGALFDEILADSRVGIVDESQTEVLDTLFYDLLDGYLIERFHTTKDAEFPKSMTCLVNTAHQLENGEGFKLEDLAKGMASCGIEESHAYKLVMDAIDDDLIEMTKETNHESDIPAPPSDIKEILGLDDFETREDDESPY